MYFAPEIQTGSDTVVSARLFADFWQKENTRSGSLDKLATREEIMMVLANVENILIRYFFSFIMYFVSIIILLINLNAYV